MTDNKNPMEDMMRFWTDGQKAFMDAQKEMAENFSAAFAPKPKDPMTQSMEAWQKFVSAWAPNWDPSSMMAASAAQTFNQQRDAFFALFDPTNWMAQAPEQLGKILESVAKAPKLADMAAPQADMAEHWQSVLEFQQASAGFARVMQEAWMRAYQRFTKEFNIEDLKSPNPQKALDAWLKFANEELLDTQATTDFMDAQRAMIASSANLQEQNAKIAEKWAESFQMPTRSEIDDLTAMVAELKREVRTLKRAAKKSAPKKES